MRCWWCVRACVRAGELFESEEEREGRRGWVVGFIRGEGEEEDGGGAGPH